MLGKLKALLPWPHSAACTAISRMNRAAVLVVAADCIPAHVGETWGRSGGFWALCHGRSPCNCLQDDWYLWGQTGGQPQAAHGRVPAWWCGQGDLGDLQPAWPLCGRPSS